MENLLEKYGLTEGIIIAALRRFDPCLKYFLVKIPFEDVIQTVRYEMCNGARDQRELYRNSHTALRQLLNDFGYGYTGASRKELGLLYSDDGELEELDRDSGNSLSASDRLLIEQVLELYESGTARDVCNQFGIQYNSTIASAFNRYFPKNVGHGGKRVGSGNKKGWNQSAVGSSQSAVSSQQALSQEE